MKKPWEQKLLNIEWSLSSKNIEKINIANQKITQFDAGGVFAAALTSSGDAYTITTSAYSKGLFLQTSEPTKQLTCVLSH